MIGVVCDAVTDIRATEMLEKKGKRIRAVCDTIGPRLSRDLVLENADKFEQFGIYPNTIRVCFELANTDSLGTMNKYQFQEMVLRLLAEPTAADFLATKTSVALMLSLVGVETFDHPPVCIKIARGVGTSPTPRHDPGSASDPEILERNDG